eukprot:3543324-Pleurochrysis_carterae.AAC.2
METTPRLSSSDGKSTTRGVPAQPAGAAARIATALASSEGAPASPAASPGCSTAFESGPPKPAAETAHGSVAAHA